MRAALAQFIFESNTFAPGEAEIDLFKRSGVWLETEAAVRAWARESDSQMRGSLEVLESVGWETNPCFAAICGSPAGRLSADCLCQLSDTLLERVAAAGLFDVLILHLHGAACATEEDDVEGHILERVRKELDYSGRLVLSLDLHANITKRMLNHADAITAYRTMPHIDTNETGERAARLAMREGDFSRAAIKIAALIPPTDTSHEHGRFAEILRKARAIERNEGILDVSLFPVQPWLDISELGSAVVITAEADSSAIAQGKKLAENWYSQRNQWESHLVDWESILIRLREKNNKPWILADTADATSGGSAGHSAEALRRLLPHKDDLAGKVLLWVVDPATVKAAREGALRFSTGYPTVEWEGRVLFKGEGRYRARGKSYTAQTFSMGEAAVIEAGQLQLVACSYPALTPDPAFYECVELDPDSALAVQVKSPAGWQAGYEAEKERGLLFDGPGSTSLNLSSLPFKGSGKKAFPVHPDPENPFEIWESVNRKDHSVSR